MRANFKCVIFDLGDTLFNSGINWDKELKVLREYDLKFSISDLEKAKMKIWENWKKIKFNKEKPVWEYYTLKFLGVKPSWKLAEQIKETFLETAKKFTAAERANPNALEIVKWLAKKGYYLGIISDAYTKHGKKWLSELGIDKHFHHISISCEIHYQKDSQKPFDLFLKKICKKHKIKLKPEECLMIGDRQGDLRGKLIGMKTCLYNPKEKDISNYKIQPDFVIKDFREIKKIV